MLIGQFCQIFDKVFHVYNIHYSYIVLTHKNIPSNPTSLSDLKGFNLNNLYY